MSDPDLLDALAGEAFTAGYQAAEEEWDQADAFDRWWREKQEPDDAA